MVTGVDILFSAKPLILGMGICKEIGYLWHAPLRVLVMAEMGEDGLLGDGHASQATYRGHAPITRLDARYAQKRLHECNPRRLQLSRKFMCGYMHIH